VLERPLAMSAIQRWRDAVLEEHRRWELRVSESKAKHKKALAAFNSTATLDKYFSTKSGEYVF